MECLNNIQKLGYAVSICNGNLKLEYLYSNDPPVEKVKPILSEIKKNKNKIIQILNNQMSLDILNFKKNYNLILDRVNKGIKFLNNCSKEEFDKYYYDWLDLTKKLSDLMQVYKIIAKSEMTDEEILQGFKL